MLFRGGTEGEIRKKLLNKNAIDTIIGLPSNLFTNTGIPVCIMILKKNRNIAEPVLVIDASKSFIKVGKQNALQEKDIAKIVDAYTNREAVAGYSHLATREEIIQNEYNMNIPRYVESLDSEIVQDVDAHLYGGIPEKNIKDLTVLQSLVPNKMSQYTEEIRLGYVKLVESVEEMTKAILADDNIKNISLELEKKADGYVKKYFEILKNVSENDDLSQLMTSMLDEIKKMINDYEHIDVYGGYQVIAEIWKESLNHDVELIGKEGFYNAGRTRVPNIVTKGTGDKKREEQDGWNGSSVSNDLIANKLYHDELVQIEEKKNRIQEIETELAEYVEAAKVEDSDENSALFDILKKDDDGEALDSFENKLLKSELKNASKESAEYKLLKIVESLIAEKSKVAKEVKLEEKELKDAVADRINVLTDEEIDMLMFEKWFGSTTKSIVSLIEVSVKGELAILKMLEERYASTLSQIDTEIDDLMSGFEKIQAELVVG